MAGQKRLPLEAELIGLLSDPHPQVRQGARQALVRLSRGNDFGPLPTATAKQISQSARSWRQWLHFQDPPEPAPEYLPAPRPDSDPDTGCNPRPAWYGHSFDAAGLPAALFDGSVRMISPTISPTTFGRAVAPGWA